MLQVRVKLLNCIDSNLDAFTNCSYVYHRHKAGSALQVTKHTCLAFANSHMNLHGIPA